MLRRLLGARDVCAKMHCSLSTWNRSRRKEAEEKGFPKPIFAGCPGQPALWDERAIDIWLDTQMDPHLLAFADRETHQRAAAAYDAADKLKERALQLSI